MASNWPPKKNVAFTMFYFIHKNDGTIIANPTLTGSNVHVDGNTTEVTDSTLAVVDATTGLCSIVLAQATMNGDQIDGTITSSSTGAVVYTFKLLTAANTQDEIVAGTVKAKVQVDAFTNDIIAAAAIADDALVAANFATGCLTADAFAADALVAATFATDCLTDDAVADSFFTVLADADAVGAACWSDADGVLVKAAVYTNAAGTDIAADIIALKAETVLILEDTGTSLPATLAAFSTTDDVAIAVRDVAIAGHAASSLGAAVQDIVDDVAATHAHAATADTNAAALVATVGAAGVGLTAVALADATSDAVIAGAVWDAAVGSYGGANSYGLLLETDIDMKLSDLPTAAEVWSDATGAAVYKGVVTDAAGENVAVDVVALKAVADGVEVHVHTTIPALIADKTGYALTAGERTAIINALMARDYTAEATADTFGKFLVALRTLLGHKMIADADPPTLATFRTKGDVGNAGTQTWSEAGKTRGEYTGF